MYFISRSTPALSSEPTAFSMSLLLKPLSTLITSNSARSCRHKQRERALDGSKHTTFFKNMDYIYSYHLHNLHSVRCLNAKIQNIRASRGLKIRASSNQNKSRLYKSRIVSCSRCNVHTNEPSTDAGSNVCHFVGALWRSDIRSRRDVEGPVGTCSSHLPQRLF